MREETERVTEMMRGGGWRAAHRCRGVDVKVSAVEKLAREIDESGRYRWLRHGVPDHVLPRRIVERTEERVLIVVEGHDVAFITMSSERRCHRHGVSHGEAREGDRQVGVILRSRHGVHQVTCSRASAERRCRRHGVS